MGDEKKKEWTNIKIDTKSKIEIPLDFNPGTSDSLIEITKHLLNTFVEEERKSVVVISDGNPYSIMQRLIDDKPKLFEKIVLFYGDLHLEFSMVRAVFIVYFVFNLKAWANTQVGLENINFCAGKIKFKYQITYIGIII
jgi:hypothetical protein